MMKKLLSLLFVSAFIMTGCGSSEPDDGSGPGGEPGGGSGEGFLSGVAYPEKGYAGGNLVITGTGFTEECKIVISRPEGTESRNLTTLEISNSSIKVSLPEELNGRYQLTATKGTEEQRLGQLTVMPAGSGKGISQLAFADILDAKALFIVERKVPLTRSTEGDDYDYADAAVMYKMDEEGMEEEVRFMGENGTDMAYMNIELVRNMSEKYIYMQYETIISADTVIHYEGNKIVYQIYPEYDVFRVIVDKNDGGVYRLTGSDFYIYEETDFQADGEGNAYFAYGPDLYKLYTKDNQAFAATINGGNGIYPYWVVDRKGNAVINGDYISLANGGFSNSGISMTVQPFICCNDSEGFYRVDAGDVWDEDLNDEVYCASLYYAIPQATNTEWNIRFNFLKLGEQWGWPRHNFMSFCYPDHTLVMGYYEEPDLVYPDDPRHNVRVRINSKDDISVEYLPAYERPQGVTFDKRGSRFPYNSQYVYGQSSTEIWRMKVDTGECEVHFTNNGLYNINWFRVSGDYITLNAFELSTGDTVLVEVAPDGQSRVLESKNGDRIIQLERLN